MKRISKLVALCSLAAFTACAPDAGNDASTGGAAATPRFDEARLMAHIEALSDDAFGGRAPGSPGEAKTVAYLTEAFRAAGLTPGNPDGTFVQDVPLVGMTTTASTLSVRSGESASDLVEGESYVAWTKRVVDDVSVAADVVFVGYGVVAPEYDWDDYKDVDVSGKVLLMLVNDPPVPGSFGDEAMTYYGRWTYKYEIAAAKGAAAAFIVHDTGPAGYGWDVVTGSWTGEQFDLESADKNMGRIGVEGWLSNEASRTLFEGAGLDFEEQLRSAADPSFRPVALNVGLAATLRNQRRAVSSKNVVGRLEGAEAAEETVMYMAHWDHLGTQEGEGDTIFNGAYDNATGVGGMVELARAFGALEEVPRRSVLFVAVTAEEQGLLGSRFYAENPLYPTRTTVAAINMDGLNVWGKTTDVTVVGLGQSGLDDLARTIASEQARILRPDPEPEKGYYYRSDHFELAKVGVPSFYADVGVSFEGKPDGWGEEQRQTYVSEDYHKPSDEVKDWYELSGMVQDLELFYQMGLRLATGEDWPEWSAASEFRTAREDDRR